MNDRNFSLIPALVLPLAACSAPTPSAPPSAPSESAARTEWICGDERIETRVDGDRVQMTARGKTVDLKPRPAASGARYQSGRTAFWEKGGAAMVEIDGEALPECALAAPSDASGATGARAAAAEPFVALGQEPGWRLEVNGDRIVILSQYGEKERSYPRPAAQLFPGRTDYRAMASGDDSAVVSIIDGTCTDAMSGAAYPARVTVTMTDETLEGCGGDRFSMIAGEWRVVSLDGRAVSGDAAPTMTFENGRAFGFSGCNRWTGEAKLTGEGLSFGAIAVTKMACIGEGDAIERAFLDLLGGVDAFEPGADGSMRFIGGGRFIEARRG